MTSAEANVAGTATNNQSTPFFSVVIPAYNAEPWIGKTLESFANQTVDDLEVIVIDDGSSDQTAAVAERFAGRMNVKVIREPRSGAPAHPCNVGTKAARGELVVCCDSDDLAVPIRLDWMRRAWDAAGRRDCLIFSDHAEIDESDRRITDSKLAQHETLHSMPGEALAEDMLLLSADAAFDALLAGCFIRPCAVAVPKRVLERVGGYEERLRNGQDYDLYLRVGREYPFVWVKHVLGLYRRSAGSISARPVTQLVPSRVAVLKRLLALPLTPEQQRTVHQFIASNYQALGYELGNRGQLVGSLRAYCNAYRHRSDLLLVRGMAMSVVKSIVRGQHRGT
jgi:glycosyltransferase involved in cell wall biosynthesis